MTVRRFAWIRLLGIGVGLRPEGATLLAALKSERTFSL